MQYHWTFFSHWGELERLNREVFPVVARLAADDTVFQGVHELVVNAMEHGNGLDPGREVSLQLVHRPGSPPLLTAIVADQGPGFDWRLALEKARTRNLASAAERGRGLCLVQMLALELRFNATGNCAYAVFPGANRFSRVSECGE